MPKSIVPSWDPAFADRSPCFDLLRPVLEQLDCSRFPSVDRLQQLVDGIVPRCANRALNLVAAGSASNEPYERRVFQTGDLAVRANDWHDLFNVLV
jgi:hypothetical protein